jgi:hypothetical protein
MTDVLLLSLGCLFLYWSVKWPWQWYRQTQATVLDAALDDPFESSDEAGDVDAGQRGTSETGHNEPAHSTVEHPSRENHLSSANQSLRRFEVLALVSCFFSPVGVAFLLHALRPHLSRPSGGLVSSSNLTLFVLAAEVRPVFHLCSLIERRTLYWQRIVSPSRADGPAIGPSEFGVILKRIESLELQREAATLAPENNFSLNGASQPNNQPSSSNSADSLIATVKQALQPQIDALNRAVRRYEKRSAAQSALLDARLRHVDGRAADALTLAAAAMRDAAAVGKPKSKPPSLAGSLVGGALAAAGSVVSAVVDLLLFPWRLLVGTGGYFLRRPGEKGSGRLRSDGRGPSYGLRGKGRLVGRRTE